MLNRASVKIAKICPFVQVNGHILAFFALARFDFLVTTVPILEYLSSMGIAMGSSELRFIAGKQMMF